MRLLVLALFAAAPAWAEIPDLDGDGYPRGIDCDDDDPTIHPRAVETPYDGIDQDCAGGDLCDVDLDGSVAAQCGGPDCDDDDPDVNPTRVEVPADGIDQDCDGVDGLLQCDLDQDGHLALWCEGGDDCSDLHPEVYPGAPEVYGDGKDQNCDDLDECAPTTWVQGGNGVRPDGSCQTAPGAAWLALVALLGLRRRRC